MSVRGFALGLSLGWHLHEQDESDHEFWPWRSFLIVQGAALNDNGSVNATVVRLGPAIVTLPSTGASQPSEHHAVYRFKL
jgi:hypothetical protein